MMERDEGHNPDITVPYSTIAGLAWTRAGARRNFNDGASWVGLVPFNKMLRGNIISVIVGWIVNTDCKREFESISYGWTCWESWFLAFLSQSVTNVTISVRDSQKLDQ